MEWDQELSNAFLARPWHSLSSSNLLIKFLHSKESNTHSILATDLERIYFESLNQRQLKRKLPDGVDVEDIVKQFKKLGNEVEGEVDKGDYQLSLTLKLKDCSIPWSLDDLGEKSSLILKEHLLLPLFGIATFKRGVYSKKDVQSAAKQTPDPFTALQMSANIYQGLHLWSKASLGASLHDTEGEEEDDGEDQASTTATAPSPAPNLMSSPVKGTENEGAMDVDEERKPEKRNLDVEVEPDVEEVEQAQHSQRTTDVSRKKDVRPTKTSFDTASEDEEDKEQSSAIPAPTSPLPSQVRNAQTSYDTASENEDEPPAASTATRQASRLATRIPSPPIVSSAATRQSRAPSSSASVSAAVNEPPSRAAGTSAARRRAEELKVSEKEKGKGKEDMDEEMDVDVPPPSQAEEQAVTGGGEKKDSEALEKRKQRLLDLKKAQEERKEKERLGIKKKRKL
ncbi:hypothetical protein BT69DRAFT_1350334 [Atractiella rhizophila]|nr:hypothetical protein BT69DRAFT_1350334 [Atractiella rhizophila]